MNFKIRTKREVADVDNQITDLITEETFEAELVGGVFKVFSTINDEKVCIQHQPFFIDDDNNRSEWIDVEQGVQWYQKMNNHVGEDL